MSNGPPSLVQLLRRCIVRGHSGPWEELLAALRDVVEAGFRAEAPLHQRGLLDDFVAWLPGWLVEGHRLEQGHAWLDERATCGGASADDAEHALRNYLR